MSDLEDLRSEDVGRLRARERGLMERLRERARAREERIRDRLVDALARTRGARGDGDLLEPTDREFHAHEQALEVSRRARHEARLAAILADAERVRTSERWGRR